MLWSGSSGIAVNIGLVFVIPWRVGKMNTFPKYTVSIKLSISVCLMDAVLLQIVKLNFLNQTYYRYQSRIIFRFISEYSSTITDSNKLLIIYYYLCIFLKIRLRQVELILYIFFLPSLLYVQPL